MKTNSAVLVIDMQKEDGLNVVNFDAVVQNTQRVIEQARIESIPVIYTRHINSADCINLQKNEPLTDQGKPSSYCSDTAAIEIIDCIKPLNNELVIDKHRYSAFYETQLENKLKKRNINHLYIVGVLSDVCILTTVFDAYHRDFKISIIEDACSATTSAAHYSAMFILSNWVYGLNILTCDNFLLKHQNLNFQTLSSQVPDHLAHEPEQMSQMIQTFKKMTRGC